MKFEEFWPKCVAKSDVLVSVALNVAGVRCYYFLLYTYLWPSHEIISKSYSVTMVT